MKKVLVATLLLISFNDVAAALDRPTTLFVQLLVFTSYGKAQCGTRLIGPAELKKIADRNGVDFNRTFLATMTAMQAKAGASYDSEALVPEITQEVGRAGDSLMNSSEEQNCSMIRNTLSNQ